jgi:hypothetical protein
MRLRLLRLPNVLLLLALLAQVLAYPFLERLRYGRAPIVLIDWVMLVLALRAARAGGGETRWGYALLLPAMLLYAGATFFPHSLLYAAAMLAQAAFHGFVFSCLLRYVLRDAIMSRDELFAGASMYALLGFAFAYLYALIELLAPGSFFINEANNPDAVISWWELLYFSFTCLTSVGFGEITPVSDHARSVVMIQQMAGVLYLAILISRLLSLHTHHLTPRDK